MLTNHPSTSAPGAPPYWVDLVDPSADERASVELAFGLRLPTREDLAEVELSSRVSEEAGSLFMNMPAVSHLAGLDEPSSPVGFVLNPRVLVTMRYAELRSFTTVAKRFESTGAPVNSVDTFTALIEAMIDVTADLLEGIAGELDGVSRTVFSTLGTQVMAARSNADLRQYLTLVGKAGAQLSRLRDSLLGLHRIVPFVTHVRRDWIPDAARERFETSQADVVSLNDYQARLSENVQFLLDAVLGFISTKQNDMFQMLTVISIIGIPPTLVASIYGMNFKNMPELNWAWGYQWGLTLIVLSAVLPVLWFKWRKWI
ncbi:MAG: magnesium transporter CorA family protein [Acidobacteria bacterium]|nr:magnesium transporter CorA family protein [Acidobacteriota bacterium]